MSHCSLHNFGEAPPIPLVLASSSPRRVELLRAAGVQFRPHPAKVRELDSNALPPRDLCLANAELKSRHVAAAMPDSLVVGADTLVALPEETFGKPADLAEARAMLQKLSGRIHEVLTGVCILHKNQGTICRFVEATRVKFRPAEDIDFDSYLARMNPLDKAGAYAAQEDGGALIESIEGSLSNVIGLPIERLLDALSQYAGYEKHSPSSENKS